MSNTNEADILAAATGNPDAEKETALKGYENLLADAGIVLADGAEFLATEPEKPVWIVEDFIAVGMKGDIIGASKSRKTFLGLSLALSVAAGKDWLDAFKVHEPHTTAYFNLELFPWNFRERMKATCTPSFYRDGHEVGGLGIKPEELRGRFFLFNLRSRAPVLRDNCAALAEFLKSHGVEFVVVDPRYKLLKSDEDENTGEGLQGVLDFRDALAENFAVLVVTHDPKGDSAQRKTTDRGAGSYRAGADYDFRLTIDRAADHAYNNLTFVVEADARARKAPAPIGVRFDPDFLTFHTGEDYKTAKLDERAARRKSAQGKAEEEAVKQDNFREAALLVAQEAGDALLGKEAFEAELAKKPGAAGGVLSRRTSFKVLLEKGVLKSTLEKEIKADGTLGNKYQGRTFVSTPDRIKAYLAQFSK